MNKIFKYEMEIIFWKKKWNFFENGAATFSI